MDAKASLEEVSEKTKFMHVVSQRIVKLVKIIEINVDFAAWENVSVREWKKRVSYILSYEYVFASYIHWHSEL